VSGSRIVLAAAAVALAWAGLALGQAPAFEVASVKVSQAPPGDSSYDTTPGRIHIVNRTLKSCIQIAYHVKEAQVSGGPKWLDSDRYDINAKAPGPAGDREIEAMLQSLLAERFQLALHRETKVTSGYALVVAKSGLRIQPVETDGPHRTSTHRGQMTAERISLPRLATNLSNLAGAIVNDETQISGVFSFTLSWTPEERPRVPAAGGDAPPPVVEAPSGPTLFAALQEQLGLKLEPRKVPLEMLVIDRAEKPDEN